MFYLLFLTKIVRNKLFMNKVKLRKARLAKNLSQEELADLVGMTQSNYSRRENGRKTITEIEWIKLAKVLGVEKDTIYEPDEEKEERYIISIPFSNTPNNEMEQIEL